MISDKGHHQKKKIFGLYSSWVPINCTLKKKILVSTETSDKVK